jgi:hypothetical protein
MAAVPEIPEQCVAQWEARFLGRQCAWRRSWGAEPLQGDSVRAAAQLVEEVEVVAQLGLHPVLEEREPPRRVGREWPVGAGGVKRVAPWPRNSVTRLQA